MNWIDITFIAVLSAAGVGLFGFMSYIVFTSLFPHKVHALKIINGKVQVYNSRARISKDKQTWRLWNVKINKFIPMPREEALEIDEKGKMSVTCYINTIGEVTHWVVYDDQSKGTTKIIESEERGCYLDEMRRDEKIGEKSLLDRVFSLLPTLALAAVIVIALFTVPDIYKEHKAVISSQGEMIKANKELTEQMVKMMDQAIQIIEDRQVLDGVNIATGEVIPN